MSSYAGPAGFAGPWSGGKATARAHCILAPNPGPMTLDGTNTWLIQEPGSRIIGIIDPGPDDLSHWDAVAAEVARRDGRIGLIVLTHGHRDHSAGALLFAQRSRCEVRALDPAHRLGDEGLSGGDVFELGGAEVRVISTPGHSADSLSFHLPADAAVLTGDTVLGRGTTVVAYPGGRLDDYLESLHRLRAAADDSQMQIVLPGHGPTVPDPIGVIDAYLAHREERLAEVRTTQAVLADQQLATADLAQRIVEIVYADVPRSVWPAALMSVRAQLEFLVERG